MTSSTNQIEQKIITHPRLEAFAKRFGKPHLNLACHAAFPLAITPELLYCLRENFRFKPQAPFIAVADILLSLCDSVGYELYEFQPEVRHQLISSLKQDFGERRLYELSDFMVAYIRQKLKTNEQTNYRADENLGAAPHWTALAYIKPQQAVGDIAKALEKALQKPNSRDWVKLTSLIETYDNVDPLIKCGFQPLLKLSRGWDAQARGDTETAEDEFAQLRKEHGKQLQVGEVQFEIPTLKDDYLQVSSFEVVTVNRRGEIINRKLTTAQFFTENLPNNIALEMAYIPGGTFMMGSPEGEGDDNEKPQHQVTVPTFFMSTTPITQEQWKAVANLPQVERKLKANPSRFKGDSEALLQADRHPVECVSWYDAVEFCARLSKHTGKEYRLPTEAEWEYACRAGTTTPFHFGETITDKLANYRANETFANEPKGEYRQETTPVGQFSPNAFGLYDMHGNVWEWCLDDWHSGYKGAPTDGSAWVKTGNKDNDNRSQSLRGGSWNDIPGICRSASRDLYFTRDDVNVSIGFRVVCGVGRTS